MENNNLWIISIVAIVAIVGMTFMFSGNKVSYAPQGADYVYEDAEGDLAGQATRLNPFLQAVQKCTCQGQYAVSKSESYGSETCSCSGTCYNSGILVSSDYSTSCQYECSYICRCPSGSQYSDNDFETRSCNVNSLSTE